MAKLLGKELENEQTIYEALLNLPGMSEFLSRRALRIARVKPTKLVGDLSEKELKAIDKAIEAPRAITKHLRIGFRKANRVLSLIRGKKVEEALIILKLINNKAARLTSKILYAAAKNAENNYGMDPEQLYVFKAVADQGPTLKRFRAISMGRAVRIKKRTSHIKIVLKEWKEGK